jgi:hypothetical protein
MQANEDLVELARICLKQAREAKSGFVSAELRHAAKGYQVRDGRQHRRAPVCSRTDGQMGTDGPRLILCAAAT